MKKVHIVLLILVAAAIAVLVSFLKTTTTYDTVATAKAKPGKFVHLMAKWDKDEPLEYDAIKNPNYLAFTAIDSLGQKINVVYHNPKPENFELSERLVMKGKYTGDVFECQSIQTKCPSKYKDEDPSRHVPQEDRKTTYNNTPPSVTTGKQ
ncbi:cytochrome c maturation protein CcmE domain-containing protein [Niabella drilacis]|uniref:Cytochrome c-type biogenesis protein CcmE n=1 Tax=Niabella drilacis (strain DSM 25811 / CCM 8410 / CCUG 62505 / LMG 26954 / E90) TaxID=1285928 RepID=A0A1G6V684_NIADE|nr:cytochrome c maturation protein CcmE [Niabella drilacis]SDD48356.1 cytochrome c-type biogenesis protein CcmE [Niabella drilacis]